jgi:hypothetical protein
MKTAKFILILVFMAFTISCQKEDGLTDDQIIEGLKAALNVGTDNSTNQAHQTDGYFGNISIKIPFPEDAQFVETALAAIPLIGQPLIDAVVLKVNRAAEDAADKAKPIFLDAITNMTFVDALNILNGENDAATQYLKANTYTQLKDAFKPDINTSLTSVGAAQAWSEVTTAYNTYIPSPQPVNTDLADYTTGKALDGLFYLVAQEEAKIRTDPAARISEILQTVFGSL